MARIHGECDELRTFLFPSFGTLSVQHPLLFLLISSPSWRGRWSLHKCRNSDAPSVANKSRLMPSMQADFRLPYIQRNYLVLFWRIVRPKINSNVQFGKGCVVISRNRSNAVPLSSFTNSSHFHKHAPNSRFNLTIIRWCSSSFAIFISKRDISTALYLKKPLFFPCRTVC